VFELVVNGTERTFEADAAPATLADLLAALGIDGRAVVAEVNGAIVPRDAFAEQPLASGDRVELVQFVGGG
jgi:thiamine biosynthesis protein ThiS